jgi:adenylate kinase family enzyme
VELDAIFHQPGWTPLTNEAFRARVDEATEHEEWVVDGNYSVVRDIVWEKADTVVWCDLPYVTVMARMVGRTLRRTMTQEELWNGNREPWSNLWSFNPEKSIIAWTATHHGRYRRRYTEAEKNPRWANLNFVRLRSRADSERFVTDAERFVADAERFVADPGSAAAKEE